MVEFDKVPKFKKIMTGGSFVAVIVAGASLVIVAAAWAANSLGGYRASQKCGEGPHSSWLLVVKDSHMEPQSVTASLCDSLTVKNLDRRGRLMAFGEHEHHETYNGITERFLVPEESFTLTLNQAGSFRIHDHNDDSVYASFVVKPKRL